MNKRTTRSNGNLCTLCLLLLVMMASPVACDPSNQGGEEGELNIPSEGRVTTPEEESASPVEAVQTDDTWSETSEETGTQNEVQETEEAEEIPMTPDTLIASVSAAVCEALYSCCNAQDFDDYFYTLREKELIIEAGLQEQLPPFVSPSDFDCPTTLANALAIAPFGPWIQAVNDEQVIFNADEATACLEELKTPSCGVETTLALFDSECFGLLPPYSALKPRRMFQRYAEPGATCMPLTDGVGGAIYGTCDPNQGWCCREREDGSCGLAEATEGVCVAASDLGEACGLIPTMQFCKSGLDCGISSCEAAETSPLETGEACYSDFTLLGICKNSYCDMFESGICMTFKQDGASCIISDECDSGSCLEGVCGESQFCTTTEGPELQDSTDTPSGPIDPAALEVARLLTGTFNSNAQSVTNPAYFDISLSSCLVRAPEYGNLVLYVEQAASDNLTQPYRQRLYVITADESTVRSEIWAPKIDFKWTGLCNKDEVTEVAGDQFTLRDGCDVWLTENTEGFLGSTEGKGCSSSLGGASYATSEVTLTEDLLRSWDQGFDSNDIQVWGATAGPYNFDRLTSIPSAEEWATLVEAQL